jgi:hypothetical protein
MLLPRNVYPTCSSEPLPVILQTILTTALLATGGKCGTWMSPHSRAPDPEPITSGPPTPGAVSNGEGWLHDALGAAAPFAAVAEQASRTVNIVTALRIVRDPG